MSASSTDTRTALLEAAALCFAEHGYSGTSMRMIADRAQRPASLITHHFKTKEALYVEVFRHMFQNVLQPTLKHQTLPADVWPRDKQEAVQVLREAYHSIYQEVSLGPNSSDRLRDCWPRIWLQESPAPRPSLHPLLKEYFGPTLTTFCKCVQTLRPDLGKAEVNLLATSVLGIVLSHGFLRGLNQVVFGEKEASENFFQSAERLLDLCLYGLLNGPETKSIKAKMTHKNFDQT